jgi:hypothetical protein
MDGIRWNIIWLIEPNLLRLRGLSLLSHRLIIRSLVSALTTADSRAS